MLKKTVSILLVFIMLMSFTSTSLATVFNETDEDAIYELAIEYLGEIGFKLQKGSSDTIVNKFAKPIVINLQKKYTEEDIAFVKSTIAYLNKNVLDLPKISLSKNKKNANIIIYYDGKDKLHKYTEFYKKGSGESNSYTFYMNKKNQITRANIAISSDKEDSKFRNYHVLFCLVHSLGLTYVSDKYTNSIFYSGKLKDPIEKIHDIDLLCLNMLYNPKIKTCMSFNQVKTILLEEK